jgi:hypothetical protein
MVFDISSLTTYVRFYLTVVTQLQSAWDAIGATHLAIRESLDPFGPALEPVNSQVLRIALSPAPASPLLLKELWKPKDEKNLSGLTDVYEVVGRFSFQGVDDENIGRVQLLVSEARTHMHEQRQRLLELEKLPEVARTTAARLLQKEQQDYQQRRQAKIQEFNAFANTLHQRANQTLEAVRTVALPDVGDMQLAGEEYRKYVSKVNQFYGTCLPFLQKALASLYEYVHCEVPSSWPETLPLVSEIPEELLSLPKEDAPEFDKAKAVLEALDEEQDSLRRQRDEISVSVSRIESEIQALASEKDSINGLLSTLSKLVEYAGKIEEYNETRQAIGSLEQQKAQRLATLGEIREAHRVAEAALAREGNEITVLQSAAEELRQRLEEEQKKEPLLFGKDDWRDRKAELERELEMRLHIISQKNNLRNQLRVDLSSLSVKLQTEQSQCDLIDRWLNDSTSKRNILQQEIDQFGKQLGSAKPAMPPSQEEAKAAYEEQVKRKRELEERETRFQTELRRLKEDANRNMARTKAASLERERAQGLLHNAQIMATQGRSEASRQLAMQRSRAVEQHVHDILGGLEKSIQNIDMVFIEPAREILLKDDTSSPSLAALVKENADKIAPIIEQLRNEISAELMAKEAMLSQIQREFCDAASVACRSAWGVAEIKSHP